MDPETLGVNVTDDAREASSQAQTPAQPVAGPDVNRQIQELNERLANLDDVVERRVQSALAKRGNKAAKQFQEDQAAIHRMAEYDRRDDDWKRVEIEKARARANIVEYTASDEPAPTPVPQPTYQNQPQAQQRAPVSQPPDDERTGIENYIRTNYRFDPKEEGVDVSEVIGIRDQNDPRLAQFRERMIDVAAAKKARQTEAARVGQGYRATGNPLVVTQGAGAPPANPYANVDDRDTLLSMAADEEWKSMQR